jgi:hypothetical protein
MKTFIAAVILTLALAGISGCGDDAAKTAKTDADIKAFHDAADASLSRMQDKYDDSTETSLIDSGRWGSNQIIQWNACKTDPPTHERGKKICAQLKKQIRDEQARFEKQEAKRKETW